jgi:hypothetical protein
MYVYGCIKTHSWNISEPLTPPPSSLLAFYWSFWAFSAMARSRESVPVDPSSVDRCARACHRLPFHFSPAHTRAHSYSYSNKTG